ncbi:MAG: U32 family peptidase, partial [Clostridia bacterium]|nr:U32 family peptidase [Clostridia bacterium]
MKRKDRLPELLAPAGSFEALIAAVEAGADAVYVGGKSFGARAFAENFDTELLSRAVEYTHLNGVRLFVTVNTLVYDRELDALSEYVNTLYEIGVDAIICADLGVLSEIKRRTPNMPVHASTQMSVNNTEGANFAYEMGCERVVLARELPLRDIRSAVENSKPEIEVFLHGALCVCHSGQCLFSSLVGGRSGNRGECAQPCRLPYNNGKYPLSLSDLSLAKHIRELCEAGVASLKIEGRMKSADYVYNVTRIYRGLLDGLRDATDAEEALLKKTFSRGGFTDGYFTDKKFSKMTGIRAERDKSQTREMAKREYREKIHPVRAFVKMRLSELCEMRLEMKNGARSATAIGQAPERANTRPLNEGEVKARLSKTGGTYFSLAPEDIELSLDENINLSPAAINALRREAVSK